jgi:hypothetical protein
VTVRSIPGYPQKNKNKTRKRHIDRSVTVRSISF